MPTRWGSTLQMISRLLLNKESVLKSLSSHKHSLPLLPDAEWHKLGNIQKLLSPVEQLCTFLGGQSYSTISVVLPVMNYLRKEMTSTDDDTGYAKKFKDGLYTDLVTRMDKVEDNAILQCKSYDVSSDNSSSINTSSTIFSTLPQSIVPLRYCEEISSALVLR